MQCIITEKQSINGYLSYDVASQSDMTPCNKIDKPLVVYEIDQLQQLIVE